MISSEKLNEAIHRLMKDPNDLESAQTIFKAVCIDNYFIISGRVNILKVAIKCVLNYINSPTNRSVTETRRENVTLKKELENKDKIIESAKDIIEYYLIGNSKLDDFSEREKELEKLLKILNKVEESE